MFKRQFEVSMYGRNWLFDIWSSNSFNQAANTSQTTIILVGGLLIDAILFILFYLLARTNRRSIKFAGKLESGYRQKSFKLLETEELKNSMMRNAIDGLLVIDLKGCIVSFNPACEKMFGYKSKEIVGNDINLLMPNSYNHKTSSFFLKYQKPEKRETNGCVELEGVRKDSAKFSLDLSVCEVSIGEKRHYFGILRDITERKQIEIMRDEFISTVNCEIRNPLTSIQGSLGLLKQQTEGQLDERGKKLVGISYHNCQKLALLLDDVLSMEKISSGKMNYKFSSVEMCQLIKEIVERNKFYASQYGVVFSVVDELNRVNCNIDKHHFEQALINILSNASKFSYEGGNVVVKIFTENKKDLILSVTNLGKGISEDFKEKIFGKFEQEDSTSTRERGGSGLGLNITKSIIEALGGSVGYESIENKETTFFFKLPIILS
jgi:PAS domain S-box-containing protein